MYYSFFNIHHSLFIMNHINSYVNDIYLAEDLMQETFFKIAVKKPKLKYKSSFKTWLYTIGRNIAIDYLRKHARKNLPFLSV